MSKRRSEIRGEMRRILQSLDPRWMAAASREISLNLTRTLDEEIQSEVEHVLAWASFFTGEVDLSSFIDEQVDRRAVYLPRALPDMTMSFISIGKDWLATAEAGHHGIPEPGLSSGVIYNPEWAETTVALVPGLAFDEFGGRLGRGGGYYDRFLSRPGMHAATKIGVGWSLQLVPEIPVKSHDILMDWLCHERAAMKTTLHERERFDE